MIIGMCIGSRSFVAYNYGFFLFLSSSSTVRIVIFSDYRLSFTKTAMPVKTGVLNAPDPRLKLCTGGVFLVGSQELRRQA